MSERDIYALDAFVGADPKFRVPVRVVSEFAWHSLFARDLFIVPDKMENGFKPEFTIVDAAMSQTPTRPRDGTNSSTFILVNFC